MIILQFIGGSILGYLFGMGVLWVFGKILKQNEAATFAGLVIGIIVSVAFWLSLSKSLPNVLCYAGVFGSVASCFFGING